MNVVIGYMVLSAVLVGVYLAIPVTQLKRYMPLLIGATGLGFLAVVAVQAPALLVFAVPTVALTAYIGVKNFRVCLECKRVQPKTPSLMPPRICRYCGARV
jgi:hypothetical protein